MIQILSFLVFHLCFPLSTGLLLKMETVNEVKGTVIKTITATVTKCALACELDSLCSVSGLSIINGVQTSDCILYQHDEATVNLHNVLLIAPILKPNMVKQQVGTGNYYYIFCYFLMSLRHYPRSDNVERKVVHWSSKETSVR